MPLPEHFFIASSGDLFDTRKPNWSANPLREGYRCTKREIKTGADLRATLRAGSWAFPGGYEIALYTSGGEMVSIKGLLADKGALYQALYDVRTRQHGRIVGADIYYEGPTMECAYTGLPIESAYGDPEENAENAD